MRWELELNEYNFEIEYLQGRMNVIDDNLSRQRNETQITKHSGDVSNRKIVAQCISKDFKMSQT